ncbi:MAG: hypothetical protein AAGG11_13215 [Pseudomonadota bacterium]
MSLWLLAIGLGLLWHGLQITWVGGLPRALRPGPHPQAERGSARAFMIFWLDQYSWIGVLLSGLGLLFLLLEVLR